MRDTVTPEALHLPPTRVIDITDTIADTGLHKVGGKRDAGNRPLARHYAPQERTPPLTRADEQ